MFNQTEITFYLYNLGVDGNLTPEEITLLTTSPALVIVRPDLITLLKKSRSNLSPTELFQFQVGIMKRLCSLESAIKELKGRSNREERNKEWMSREIFKVQRHVLKTIMDGIAWRHLGFRRSILRLISEHNQTGFLEDSFDIEFSRASKILADTGGYVILNDLTNVLRHGDITIVKGRDVYIDEVKGGKSSASNVRAINQRNRLDEVIGMINTGKMSIGSQSADVVMIPGKMISLLPQTANLVRKTYAGETGVASERLSPYLWARCVYVDRFETYLRTNKVVPPKQESPFGKSTYPIFTGSLVLLGTFSPNMAPYSIFPFDEEISVDLMLGRLSILTRMGERELVDAFAGKGWLLEYPSSSLWNERLDIADNDYERRVDATRNPKYMPKLSRDGFELSTPWDMLYRVTTEFLSIKAVVAQAEYLRNLGAKGYVSIDFEEEKTLWV